MHYLSMIVLWLVTLVYLEGEILSQQSSVMLLSAELVCFAVQNSSELAMHVARYHSEEVRYVFDNPAMYLKIFEVPYHGTNIVNTLKQICDILYTRSQLKPLRQPTDVVDGMLKSFEAGTGPKKSSALKVSRPGAEYLQRNWGAF
eukprot:TRINITY_DN62833_c0_g1_i1.p2 TRINITY_DN62833_c0_g1~~TRINITY_DN62833_c0_g1_i1.p2  ORF type:complete len:145 (-),score=25.29 TRINITY_DN62833_c0_g1_i1:70-504(-)